MRKKILFLTNIPAPYRLDFYNKLSSHLNEIGVDLHVIYLSEPYRHRSWKMDESDFKHSYQILKNRYVNLKNGKYIYHYNLGVASHIEEIAPDLIVICGIFSTPFLSTLFRLKGKSVLLLWTETNMSSSTMKGGVMKRFKSLIYKRFDGYIIPGMRSLEYIEWLSIDISKKKVIKLPNLIQEFDRRVDSERRMRERKFVLEKFTINHEDQIWFAVSQLIKRKGLDIIIRNLRDVRRVVLFIAGDGPELETLKALVENYNVKVYFLGNCDADTMSRFYRISDLFVLGSFRDPSPLSAIEALSFSKPICISQLIGNAPEVLVEGRNGWSYNPHGDQNEINRLFKNIASLDLTDLRKMGEESLMRYEDVFSVDKNIKNFTSQMLNLISSS